MAIVRRSDVPRVGIVTLYHKNYNYGGLLQALALQRAITALGVSSEAVTFDISSTEHWKRRLEHLSLRQIIDAGARYAADRFAGRKKKTMQSERRKAFEDFESLIPHSPLISNADYIEALEGYSILICGSDQVWNPAWWNDILLLRGVDGAKVRKTAYAASMGCTLLGDDDMLCFSSALSDYKCISVREKSALKLIELATGGSLSPELALDPTLLITRDQWFAQLPRNDTDRIPSDPYALIYMVDKQGKYTEKSIEACLGAGLVPVVVSYNLEKIDSLTKKQSAVVLHDCNPSEWVNLLNLASIVVTDSFHGVAFSCNFNKRFWCFRKSETINGANRDDRQEGLLKRFGLEDRLVEPKTVFDQGTFMADISFERCNEELARERMLSYRFLKKCLDLETGY